MGYQQKAIFGFGYQSIVKILNVLISALKVYFLARLLSPDDFGLFSLTAIALGLTESLTETGVNLTIIQSKQSVKYFLNTAYVISIIRGFAIAIIMIILAIILQKSFNSRDLLYLITLASLIPIIKGFINPAIISYYKQLEYFKDAFFQLFIQFIIALFSVLLAIYIRSAYALILAMIFGAALEVILTFLLFEYKPNFEYIPSRGKIILKNTKWLSISAFFNYANDNLDDFFLGKIFGTHLLGIYHNAYMLSHKTNYEIAKAAYYSSLPILSKIGDEPERQKRAFYKTLKATMIITTLLSLPFFLFSKPIIEFLLGEQWLSAIPLIRPLLLAGLIHSFSLMAYSLLMAKKEYQAVNWHLFANTTLMIIGIFFFAKNFGMNGSVYGILLSRLITLPIILVAVKKSLERV